MDSSDRIERVFDRLVPWLAERTGVDQETIMKVIEGQARFWDVYQEEMVEIEKALDEEDED